MYLLVVLFLFRGLLKYSLRPDSLHILLSQRYYLEAAWIPLCIRKPILAFHEHIPTIPLNGYIFIDVVVGVELPIV